MDSSSLLLYYCWLSALLVICAGFTLLYRRLARLEQRLQPKEAVPVPAPAPHDELRYLLLFASVVVLVALVIMLPVHEALDALGLVVTSPDPRPLHTWTDESAVSPYRFQWHAFDLDNVTRYPVIECAYYDEALDVQESLLGPLPELASAAAVAGHHDPSMERQHQDMVKHEERRRGTARRRCVLNPLAEHLVINAHAMQYLTDARQPSLIEVLGQQQGKTSRWPPVRHVLQTRDGVRFYAVSVVVPNQTHTVPTALRVERRVVSEEQLLRAPADWYHKFCINPLYSKGIPCICPVHFGLVNTGFYFHFEAGPGPAVSGECHGQWRLWALSRVVRPVTGSELRCPEYNYQNNSPTDFPFHVMAKLNVSCPVMNEMTTVEALDVAAVFQSPQGALTLERIDPNWLAPHLPSVNLTASPLLSILPLDEMLGKDGGHMRTLKGDLNSCFGYCLDLDERIAKLAGLEVTG